MPVCTAGGESSEALLCAPLHSFGDTPVCSSHWKIFCWLIAFICCYPSYSATLTEGPNNIQTSSNIGNIREGKSL